VGSVLICGGGAVGLATAMLLARDGHAVTVLEADPAAPPPVPLDAWTGWDRPGVAQFEQPHNLLPRFRQELATELPDVLKRLLDAGCWEQDALRPAPPALGDLPPEPGDERFTVLIGRRPVVEAVLAQAADDEPGVDVRRGVKVTGLLAEPGTLPRVVGVRTSAGDLRADLVLDAGGRRSAAGDRLAEIGARRPEELAEDSGFVYYTRYLRGELPRRRSAPTTVYGTFAVATLPGDHDTWAVTVFGSSRDRALTALRRDDVFDRLIRALPLHAHWLDGEPVTPVLPMAGVLDRYRRFVLDGEPVATGFAAVGDAWACTNPSAARGLSLGLAQARMVRDELRARSWNSGARSAGEFELRLHERAETELAPYYWEQVNADRARVAVMDALRAGDTPSPPPDSPALRLLASAFGDPVLYRAFAELTSCFVTMGEVLARPEIAARLTDPPAGPPFTPPGPDRTELLALLGG
jgi:2-polyprenyl-6-methoxyphenol hydroxylase-like FAD-dependent oxidoreductase